MTDLLTSESGTESVIVGTTGLKIVGGLCNDEPILEWKLPTGYRVAGFFYNPGPGIPDEGNDRCLYLMVKVVLQAHLSDGTVIAETFSQRDDDYDLNMELQLDLTENTDVYYTLHLESEAYHLINPWVSETITYYTEYLTNLTMNVDKTSIFAGEQVLINGNLTYGPDGFSEGAVAGGLIVVEFSDGRSWSITTDVNGFYAFMWSFPAAGTFEIIASFAGGVI